MITNDFEKEISDLEAIGIKFSDDKKTLSSAKRIHSNITSVVIPHGVTSIADGAFRDRRSITDIAIPETVTTIGAGAFQGVQNWPTSIFPTV